MSEESTLVRIYHSSNSNGQHNPNLDPEAMPNIIMFKTLKCTPTLSASELLAMLQHKLKINIISDYGLYSLDKDVGLVKRKLDPSEIVWKLVGADVSSQLKLAILHNAEAEKIGRVVESNKVEEFYEFNGTVITGPYPKIKEQYTCSEKSPTRHRKLLNAEYNGLQNLTLVVEGEKIYSNRAIFEKRCPELLTAVSFIKKKKETKGNFLGPIKIEFKDNTVLTKFAMYQILDWIYTGSLDFVDLRLVDVMVVLYVAQQLEIPHLVYICEQFIRGELSPESVFVILKQARLLKMNDISELAVAYAHDKWAQVATNRKGMELIGLEMFQELTISMQQKKPIPDPRPPVENTTLADFQRVYTERMFTDGEAIFSEGEPVKFHRAIVCAYSKPLANLIMQSKSKQTTFEGFDQIGFENLLKSIYYGDNFFDPFGACTIIEFGLVPLGVSELREPALNSLTMGINARSVLPILRVTYLSQAKHRLAVKLRELALQFICENFENVPVGSVKEFLPTDIAHQMMADILEALYFVDNPESKSRLAASRSNSDVSSVRRTTSGTFRTMNKRKTVASSLLHLDSTDDKRASRKH